MPRPPAHAPLLNEGLICRHALEIIDAEGIDNLSMRKLATALNVSTRSLYHYFANKDALLRAVYIEVLRKLELPNPQTENWQTGIRRLATNFRAICFKHPNVAPYFLNANLPTKEDLSVLECLMSFLDKAGFPREDIDSSAHSMTIFIISLINQEIRHPINAERIAKRYEITEEQPKQYPTFLSLPNSREQKSDHFELALELLIAGVETRAQQT